jgi:hypothetical protein
MPCLRRGLCLIAAAISLAAPARADAPATQPSDRFDEAHFRQALQQRGLTALLDHYDQQHPPKDDLSRRLRQLDHQRHDCDDPQASANDRQSACDAMIQTLEQIIAAYPDHEQRYTWRLDLARDRLERQHRQECFAVLFALPSKAQQQRLATAAKQSRDELDALAASITAEWNRIGELPPDQYDALANTDALQRLESIEAELAYWRAWGALYWAMTQPPESADRTAALQRILDDVATRYRWTAQPHEQTHRQIQSLLMAAIAARLLDKYDLADEASAQAVRIAAHQREQNDNTVDRWLILGLLERIRLTIDRGHHDEALAAIQRAYEWLDKTDSNDLDARIAFALLERRATSPSETVDPLSRIAKRGPDARAAIYRMLGPAACELTPPQVTATMTLACIAHRIATETDIPAAVEQAQALAASAEDPLVRSEARWLQAQALITAGEKPEAVNVLLQLMRENPNDDRAGAALDTAVALAANALREQGTSNPDDTLALFLTTVDALRKHRPDDPRLPSLAFAAGLALQNHQRWHDAIEQFALVPADHERGIDAARHRLECLVTLHRAAPTKATATAVVEAADELRRRLPSTDTDAPSQCLRAEALVMKAHVQASPILEQYTETLDALRDFDQRFADCTPWVSQSWSIRLRAAEALGRLTDAAAFVDEVVRQQPKQAGPVLEGLLLRMREQIDDDRDAGRESAARDQAAQAAALTAKIETWAQKYDTNATPSWRRQRAMLLLDAGQYAAAAALADRAAPDHPVWTFVRAEVAYHNDDFPTALPLYRKVWDTTPENQPLWWRAFLRNLQCHVQLGTDHAELRAAIAQQRHRYPDMGGPAMQRELNAVEKEITKK